MFPSQEERDEHRGSLHVRGTLDAELTQVLPFLNLGCGSHKGGDRQDKKDNYSNHTIFLQDSMLSKPQTDAPAVIVEDQY